MTDSVARRLAVFLSKVSFQSLSQPAVEHAKLAIADTLGSALAGSDCPSVEAMRRLVLDAGGAPEATLWGRAAEKVPVASAARFNAVLADALAIGESHMATVAHLCGVTVPAAMAVGERVGATGSDLITAVVLGYEVAGRVGKSVAPGYFHERGFHNSVVTIFGSATAAAKLLGLDSEPTTHALALAATSAGGLAGSRMSPAREYHAGNSAMLGVQAALAAALGYEGLETAFENPEGYHHAFGTGEAQPGGITESLGEGWEIETEFAPKFMPGSHGIHTVVEAALNAIDGTSLAPEDIATIAVTGPRWKSAYGLYQPRDLATASHSIPYFVARAMVAGKIGWDDLAPKRILDPAIQGLQDKVEIVEDAALDPYDYPGGATVVVTTAEGTQLTATVDHAPGTPQRGCSGEDIEAKYRELAPRAGLSTLQIKDSLSAFKCLEDVPDICNLMPCLVAGKPGARRGEN